jgi:hypothetical protein
MDEENLPHLYNRTRTAADVFHAQAIEILEMAKELERLTKDTPAWYASTRARVEARLPWSRLRIYARHLMRWVSR